MKVALNVDAVLWPPLTGVGHYTRHVLDGLLATPGIDLTCVGEGRAIPVPAATGGVPAPPRRLPWVKRALMQVPGLVTARNAVRAAQARHRTLPCQLYHEPNHIVTAPAGPRVVVTMHDLSVLHFPQFHPPARVRAMTRARFAASAARADRVIAGSEHTRQDVIATLGVDPAKVDVVHHGAGPEFRPGADLAVLAEHGLAPGRYLLALGTREPRKNLGRLLDAYMALPADLRADHPLALVGPPGWRAEALEARIDALQRTGAVRLLGYVPDGHRPALYGGAAGFAYPSLYEGFGLPVIEAAACGAPVLTSTGSPMAEVLGDLAILVDPEDPGAIAAGLQRLLTDPAVARAARDAAPGVAGRFTWQACVAGTIDVYRAALA